jgi:serine/threonine protein kinase
MTAAREDLFPKGQRIDRYEIREHVGQGGMGEVYRAIDTKLGRTVALKTVVAHRRGDRLTEEIRQRFMREALAASRVEHRNVVQVLDFGFADDGTPYMVMEYLRGRSLSEVLKAAKEPLALDYVADIVLSVCAALRACHHVGIIHRDLKPANIFLCDMDTGWEAKVLDFGISKAHAADELTQEGQIIGTPQYLSPEQIDGVVGFESDQYAVGVLMYMCLTQRLPFAGLHGTRLMRAIGDGQFDAPRKLRPDLPEGLEAILLRAMRTSPRERFESIHALGQKLWEFASPRGQAQWRTFYFHTPSAAAEPADVPERRRADSTVSFEAASVPVKTAAHRPSAMAPESLVPTKTAAAPDAIEAANASHSDIAGESALSDAADPARGAGARTRTRRLVVVGAVLAACIGALVERRAWRAGGQAAPTRATVVAAPPAQPTPVQPAPVRAAAPMPPPPAAPAPPPVAAPPTGSAARAPDPPPSPTESPRKKKHATPRRHAPKTDQHGIGIPTE